MKRPEAFLRHPEPLAIGHPGRGRAILGGELVLRGHVLRGNPFSIQGLPLLVRADLHGFGWLDDLAALANADVRALVQKRVLDWQFEHPDPAEATVEWLAEIAGRRLLRWLFHAGLILPGLRQPDVDAFVYACERHLSWLSDTWSTTPDGLPRIEALSALVFAGFHLHGHDHLARVALVTLAEEAEAMGQEALTAARSAEATLDAASLLTWATDSARQAGVAVPAALGDAIAGLAQSLRAIRHADGGLPQFHGGGRGAPGRLDRCLSASPGPAVSAPGKPLGYARMARGRTTLIMDAAPPPLGDAAGAAHASTLGFELVCARQPIILSCGPGDHIGPTWVEAARRSHNHSTLTLAGMNSSRFIAETAGPDLLADSATRVWAGDFDEAGQMTAPDCGPAHSANPAHLLSGHDGWLASHGLTCLRELWLEPDGLTLDGEDSLVALDPPAQELLDQRLAERGATGIGLDIRFHLHPAVQARIEGEALRLILPEGEDWFFSHDGNARMRLEPSHWLDPDRRQPVASQQIVLSALLTARAVQVGWTFARAAVR